MSKALRKLPAHPSRASLCGQYPIFSGPLVLHSADSALCLVLCQLHRVGSASGQLHKVGAALREFCSIHRVAY